MNLKASSTTQRKGQVPLPSQA